MDITLPGFKYLGHMIEKFSQRTKQETPPRTSDTSIKPLAVETFPPSSPLPSIVSSSPVRSNTPSLDFKSIGNYIVHYEIYQNL